MTNQTTQEFENRKKQLFSGRFTIGCVEADNSDTLALLLEELIRDYPSVQFHIHSGTSDDITERLEKGLLDLAILLDPVDTEKYETILLPRKEKWGLLISKASDLAQKDAIKKEDFSNVSLLISKRPEIQRMLADWLGIKKEQLLITGTYNLIFNVFSLIENQVGAALVIEGAVSNHSKEVRFVPLDPLIETNCMLVWKKNRILSPVVNELIHRFKEAFEQ
ncbi:LysR family transcriptional regulator substrate-binding protein [Enterococcus faecium]|nr:LysR family transcriptional regulator substrate-binding protein [Enterococcus faecium]EKZ0101929.1 LysR family transcriptional regulator substrate-binding protein [Enterococcus faecium]EME3566333.1 LysR family transcriptional regulator substrate-binding protein [Enterococcus faecium]